MSRETPVEVPLRVRWREFRVRVLPAILFLLALRAVIYLWPLEPQPEVRPRHVTSTSRASSGLAND